MKLAICILAFGALFLDFLLEKCAWNLTMPHYFGLPSVTYWQAAILGMVIGYLSMSARGTTAYDKIKEGLSSDDKDMMDLTHTVSYVVAKLLGLGVLWLVVRLWP